jgi:hypothetical protein
VRQRPNANLEALNASVETLKVRLSHHPCCDSCSGFEIKILAKELMRPSPFTFAL